MPQSPAMITPLVSLDSGLPENFADTTGSGLTSAQPIRFSIRSSRFKSSGLIAAITFSATSSWFPAGC